MSRLTTVGWGVVITICAFFAGEIAETVIESINKVGSAFYGPILAVFTIGVLSKRNYRYFIFIGIIAGVLFNVCLWIFFQNIFWMWWNLFGFAVTILVTEMFYAVGRKQKSLMTYHQSLKDVSIKIDWKSTLILIVYFALILTTLIAIHNFIA